MASIPLDLPLIQNWSCHNCGGCCRQHGIFITPEERSRIQQQNWQPADGIPAGRPLFIEEGGWLSRRRQRLAHQPDGACVFLDEKGLCRIHAKFGETAKPLACRIYPYAFHPAGKSLAVSLRFSCPSVTRNAGLGVARQGRELKELAAATTPAGFRQLPPPKLNLTTHLSWEETAYFVRALEQTLSPQDVPIGLKVLRALHWVDLVDQADFEKVRGERIAELLDLLVTNSELELPDWPSDLGAPSSLGQTHFRLLAGQYARKDTQATLDQGWLARWRNLKANMTLARGRGELPAFQEGLSPVEVSQLNYPPGMLGAESEELLTRYFLVKVHSWSFFGAPYYGIPFTEGFRSFALTLPVIGWIARWLSISAGRDEVKHEDVSRAVNIVDHQHGYSPAFGTWGFRSRVKNLQQLGDIEKLLVSWTRTTSGNKTGGKPEQSHSGQ